MEGHNEGGILLHLPRRPQPRAIVRVLIVEAERLRAEALMFVLAADPGCEAIGYALTGLEALELAAAYQPDVVVVGDALPDVDTGGFVEIAVRLSPGSRVIVLSEPCALAEHLPAGCSAVQLLEAIGGDRHPVRERRDA